MKKMLFAALLLLGVGLAAPTTVRAMDLFSGCTDADCSVVKDTSLQQGATNFKVKNIINFAIYILGGVAVMMIIIGGIRIAISNGEASAVKAGKDTILWAVIGVVVSVMAYTIVNFVVQWKWTS